MSAGSSLPLERKEKEEKLNGNKEITCPHCGWKGKSKHFNVHFCPPKDAQAS